MTWETSEPLVEGWYLCTSEDAGGQRFVIPIYRSHRNEKWEWNCGSMNILAAVRYPEPYDGNKIE